MPAQKNQVHHRLGSTPSRRPPTRSGRRTPSSGWPGRTPR